MIELDAEIRKIIVDEFPDASVPDENNYLPSGQKYAASDHYLPALNIQIERKTIDRQRDLLHDLSKISWQQGGGDWFASGTINAFQITAKMPNPKLANRQLTDYLTRRTIDYLKDAAKKFESVNVNSGLNALGVLTLCDKSQSRESIAHYEWAIVNKLRRWEQEVGRPAPAGVLFAKRPDTRYGPSDRFISLITRSGLQENRRAKVDALLQLIAFRLMERLFSHHGMVDTEFPKITPFYA